MSETWPESVGICSPMTPEDKIALIESRYPGAEKVSLRKGAVIYRLSSQGKAIKFRLEEKGIEVLMLDRSLDGLPFFRAGIALGEAEGVIEKWIGSGSGSIKRKEGGKIEIGQELGKMGKRPYWWRK